MKTFKLNKEEWYKLRDDRTLRVDGVKGFDTFSVGIIVSTNNSSTYANQVIALVCTNILSRWCKAIYIKPTHQKSVLPNSTGFDLDQLILDTMTDSDPHGNFQLRDFKPDEVDLVIYIGNAIAPANGSISVIGSGWVAGISNSAQLDPLVVDNTNVVGPAFAACLASAYAFNLAISKVHQETFTKWYSLYDFTSGNVPPSGNPPINDEFYFGKILQVGCGAVGSSLDYLIALMRFNADISIADFDTIEPPNCSSSLAFTAFDSVTDFPTKKVDVCHNVLKRGGKRPYVFPDPFTADIYSASKPDLILCLANERSVWPTIQYNYPPLVLHATTTPNWGINFGRHIPLKEWCIVCRFGITDYKFKPACSTAQVEIEERKILGVLPFLSPGAAVITLSEILKLSLPCYPLNMNFYQFSFKNFREAEFIGQQKDKRVDCPVCSAQDSNIHEVLIKDCKYFKHSDQ